MAVRLEFHFIPRHIVDYRCIFIHVYRIAGLDEMARTGMYMSDLGMYGSSQEMVLSGIQPLPQLEYARDQVCDLN